ncbi:hypothetical protein [Rhodanobacter sp. BL-MT-08]
MPLPTIDRRQRGERPPFVSSPSKVEGRFAHDRHRATTICHTPWPSVLAMTLSLSQQPDHGEHPAMLALFPDRPTEAPLP